MLKCHSTNSANSETMGEILMGERRITTTSGDIRAISGTTIEALAMQLRGKLLTGDDDGYDLARTVWNGLVDKRPALIACCAGAADVIACVRFARDQDLLLSIRGGGHSIAGRAVCDNGIMI